MLKYSKGFIKNNFEIFRSVDLSVYIRNILQSLHNQCVFSLVIVHSVLRSPFTILVVNYRGEVGNGVGCYGFFSFNFILPFILFPRQCLFVIRIIHKSLPNKTRITKQYEKAATFFHC